MTTRPTRTRTRTRRPGLTLTEALVALFVAAIGMIALMTLFPLGALQMGQALKDERTSQAAMQADGLMRWYWKTFVVETSPPDTAFDALDNPNASPCTSTRTVPSGMTAPIPATSHESSFPVFVDPIGSFARTGRDFEQFWVAGIQPDGTPTPSSTFLPPRRNLTQITSNKQAIRLCSLLDDLTYDDTGAAGTTGTVERQGRYNWLAVVQRPDNSARLAANLTVVVFDGRAPSYAPAGIERSFSVVSGTVIPGSTAVSISFSGDRPAISKGRWIMDATQLQVGTANIRHAKFYRVVSVNDETSGQLDLELQTPITRLDRQTVSYTATFIVLTGVAEVFERPQLNAAH